MKNTEQQNAVPYPHGELTILAKFPNRTQEEILLFSLVRILVEFLSFTSFTPAYVKTKAYECTKLDYRSYQHKIWGFLWSDVSPDFLRLLGGLENVLFC